MFFTVKAESDREAKIKAERFIDNLCTAVLLSTNIAVDVDNIDIVEIHEIHKSDSERTKTRVIHEIVKIKDDVSVGLGLSETHIRSIVKIAKEIEGLNKLISRFFRWYRWALLEDDPIDKFIKLWIAFEIWAEHKGYKSGKEGEKTKMTNALVKECGLSEKEVGEVYDIRCALFHSGTYDKILSKLSQLEKCLATIVSEVKQTLSKKLRNEYGQI